MDISPIDIIITTLNSENDKKKIYNHLIGLSVEAQTTMKSISAGDVDFRFSNNAAIAFSLWRDGEPIPVYW
jgi:hypothetical protein